MKDQAKHLFWTGGWDSTFRLLDLLLVKRRPVKPFYVVNLIRPSFPEELRTISKIRNMVFERSPEARDLLLPMEIRERGDIRPDERIAGQFRNLSAVMAMGQQYEYLARFASELGLRDMELSVRSKVHKFLASALIREEDGNDSYFRLRDELIGRDMEMFSYFHFPVLHLDKLDMEKLAVQHGFADIMEETWFCYTPSGGRTACGHCNPCQQVIRAGMGRRIPWLNRIRGSVKRRGLWPRFRSLLFKPIKDVSGRAR